MTVTLSEIKSDLRGNIGRGTALDANLHSYLQRAIRHIERKKNFTFMYHLNSVENSLSASHPRTLRIPNHRVREIDFMRVTQEDGELTENIYTLGKCTMMQRWGQPETTRPTEYFLAQEDLIIFNHTPDAVYTFDVGWWEYTILGTADATEHWLFDNAQDLVVDYATMFAAKSYRDYQRAQAIELLATKQMDEFMGAEEDKELGGEEIVMQTDFISGYDDSWG